MLLKAGTQYAIRNTQYANPVKLYCVIRKRLPQDAIAQNAAYGVPYISRILICIQCDTKEARKIHVILMYLIGNPKCILDSFEGTCKRYMFSLGMSQSMQDTFEIHQDTSGYMYPSGYMQDTSGYVS
jgi:hypothetical protein